MKFIDDGLISGLLPAETASFPSPVPTQIVSSDEYLPVPQTVQQKEVEARLIEMSDRLAKRQGLSRRRFFQTAPQVAAAAMEANDRGHVVVVPGLHNQLAALLLRYLPEPLVIAVIQRASAKYHLET